MTYRVLSRLAAGGFSDIFEVEDRESALAERLVLKRLNAEMSAKPGVREAFAGEAEILRDLKHPNVVTFRRCYIDAEGRICLVMEKVEGDPLDRWAESHESRPEVVLDLFERVLGAVDYLHHRPTPYLHLDLKPDNILVTRAGSLAEPVLIDFGIARRSGRMGLKAYTPPYGAPEQVAGHKLDCSTDVYALGQILGELLDRFPAAQADDHSAVREVVRRATQPQRRRRYADAGALRLALRKARRDGSPEERAFPLEFRRRLPTLLSPVGWRAVMAIAALALLFSTFWVLASGGSENESSPASLVPGGTAQRDGVRTDGREHFIRLVAEGRDATYQRRFERAEEMYEEARTVLAEIPDDDRHLERELTSLRRVIDMVRQGGPEGERVRLDLH